MVAAFSAQTQPRSTQPSDRPEGMPWIHSTLDDADLTPEAFRVCCHLARKVRCDRSGRWYAWPSLDDIAAVCFRRSYPNSPASVLRRKTFDAIDELEQRQLLEVERFKGKGNKYYLLPLESWLPAVDMPDNRNVRKGRSKKSVAPDPGRIRSETVAATVTPDPGRIRLVLAQNSPKTPACELSAENSALTPDPPRITKYIYLKNLKRERRVRCFARTRSPDRKTKETELQTTATTAAIDQKASVNKLPSVETSLAAAAPTPQNFQNFAAAAYHWPCYSEPGCGGSHPDFFAYVLHRMRAYNDRRVRTGNKRIDNLEDYTLGAIHRDGAKFYQEFEIDAGFRLPPTAPTPALPADAPSPQTRARADSQAGGSNGSLKPFQVAEAPSAYQYELQPEEMLKNRQDWCQKLLETQRFKDLKAFLDGLIARGERSQVELLLRLLPDSGFAINGRKVWRPT